MWILAYCAAILGCEDRQVDNADGKVSPPDSSPLDTKSPDYIGTQYGPDSIPGVQRLSGALVDPSTEPTKFAVAEVKDTKIHMLWFSELTHFDTKGKAHWIVRDVLTLPSLDSTEVVSLVGFCFVDQVRDPEVVAVAKWSDTEFYTEIVSAWRASRRTAHFAPISVKGLRCENEGYGAE